MSRSFDGVDDRLTTSGSVLNPSGTPVTIVGWVNPAIINATKYIFSINDGAGTRALILINAVSVGPQNGGLQFQRSDSTQTAANFLIRRTAGGTSDGLIQNSWNAIAVTHDGVFTTFSSVHVYINFLEKSYDASAQQNGSGTEAAESGTWSIGGRTSDNAVNFNGKIAHVQYFNRVLSINEITQATYYPGSVTNGLKWYVPCWGGSPEGDYSSSKIPATVTNGVALSNDNPPINGIFKKKRSSLHYATMFPVASGGAPPPTTNNYRFRKTLSGLGTRTFSRQVHGWGN